MMITYHTLNSWCIQNEISFKFYIAKSNNIAFQHIIVLKTPIPIFSLKFTWNIKTINIPTYNIKTNIFISIFYLMCGAMPMCSQNALHNGKTSFTSRTLKYSLNH